MIDMYTARTSEIDEIDEAIEEIFDQIDLSVLKTHTGGLLYCHRDFIESGVVEKLCEQLPFDVIGMTAMAGADEHGFGNYDLTLTILTSDDVSFVGGMTESINSDNYKTEIENLYKSLHDKSGGDPALIITFMPHMKNVAGCEVVAAMDAACDGLPMWGSLTNSDNFNYETVQTICNGKSLATGTAMLLIRGDIKPKFILHSIPERNIGNSRIVVTKSIGTTLYEVNDMPVLDYMNKIGLVITKENITTTPIMVYYKNAENPVALGFYTMFDDGSVLTGGEMPEGTSISVGSIDAPGIFETAEAGISEILACEDRQVTLLLPCITRYLMLSPDQDAELRLIEDKLTSTGKPFAMGYSGGEISPIIGPDGKQSNQFHNYTFCACVF